MDFAPARLVQVMLQRIANRVTQRPCPIHAQRDVAPSLTVLAKSRHYAHFFKQEVSLDEGTAGV
jgi:hypothetical protein